MGSTGMTQAQTIRFRRVPRPFRNVGSGRVLTSFEKEKACERRHGHVLIVTAKGIECRECGAEWEDCHF